MCNLIFQIPLRSICAMLFGNLKPSKLWRFKFNENSSCNILIHKRWDAFAGGHYLGGGGDTIQGYFPVCNPSSPSSHIMLLEYETTTKCLSVFIYVMSPPKMFHLFVRGNSSKTNEPSNYPILSEESDRSGGVHEGEFLKIRPELVAQNALKEKKYGN